MNAAHRLSHFFWLSSFTTNIGGNRKINKVILRKVCIYIFTHAADKISGNLSDRLSDVLTVEDRS